eukprot:366367-Chlamydomonas_euryale.AAC.3
MTRCTPSPADASLPVCEMWVVGVGATQVATTQGTPSPAEAPPPVYKAWGMCALQHRRHTAPACSLCGV